MAQEDNGFTQINDIVLDIPPQQINISRRSVNNVWHTLRTSSSIKSKSGLSRIDINISAVFTDTPSNDNGPFPAINGYEKLQRLVAQFRITPFCYVENKLIRSSILGQEKNTSHGSFVNMALALKQLRITKDNNSTNTIVAQMSFCWFNYFPYLKNFTYKKQIFTSEEVVDPKQSEAWQLMYQAELERNPYSLNADLPLTGNCTFSFKEFATTQVKDVANIIKKREAYREIRNSLANFNFGPNHDGEKLSKEFESRLEKHIDKEEAVKTANDLVGLSTSMAKENIKDNPDLVIKTAIEVLDKRIDKSKNSNLIFKIGELSWSPVLTKKGNMIKAPSDITSGKTNKDEVSFSPKDAILVERKRSLTFEDEGLIIQSLSISFENVLAMMPIIGHAYPTFQHIGSVDAIVTINAVTTSQAALRELSTFYSSMEEQAYKFKSVLQGQKNIFINNDLINLCGLKEFILDSMNIVNVQGQPGTYQASISLINNPLSANTKERISAESKFTTTNSTRNAYANVIEQNISLRTGLFEVGPERFNKYRNKVSLKIGLIERITGGANVFLYNPSYDSTARNENNAAFRSICEEYAELLSEVFIDLVDNLQEYKSKGFLGYARDFSSTVADFYNIDNNKIPGIEYLQEKLLPVIQLNDNLKEEYGSSLESVKNTARDLLLNSTQQGKQFLDQLKKERNDAGFFEGIANDLQQIRYMNKIDRINQFIDEALSEWNAKKNKLLDKLTASNGLGLPQFQEVVNQIQSKGSKNTTNCYPDFPLEKVVNILESGANSPTTQKIYQEAFKQLNDLFKTKYTGTENIGLLALIQPDFYLFNQQNDTIDAIVSPKELRAAQNAIKKIHSDKRLIAEENWIDGAYRNKILGENKYTKIIANRNKQKSWTQKYSELWTDINTSTFNDLKSALTNNKSPSNISNNVFVPDDLDLGVDDTEGMACSLAEYKAAKNKPLQAPIITDKEDQDILFNARRDASETSLNAPALASQAKHRLGLSSISRLPAVAYLPPQPKDPNKTPIFNWPTGPEARVKTSRFSTPDNPRTVTVTNSQTGETYTKTAQHNGLDLATRGIGKSLGLPVYASADGTIEFINYSPTESEPGKSQESQGNEIRIKHTGGWTTVYYHLHWDDLYQAMSDLFWGKTSIGTAGKKNKFEVTQGQHIANIGQSGSSKGAHLHFGVLKNGQWKDPEEAINGGFYKSQGPLVGINPANEDLISKSMEQVEKDMHNGQGYSMMRAYPTFRFYFIESDLGERKQLGFDDLFSYSSIKEIQLIRSKKLAADLCVIQITNISGNLNNKKFDNADGFKTTKGKDVKEERYNVNTKDENPIASLMLQPGVEVQLRLGYSANPSDLEKVFNGVITDVQFINNDDLVQITCQSFGIELVQSMHGTVKGTKEREFGGFLSGSGRTSEILEELIASPEVVHFGRWEGGEANQTYRDILTTRWSFKPSPADDNIFAPAGSRGIKGIWDSTKRYILYNSTIWDTFQEMTLRHPGMIACPVPYEGFFGPRMTMFFGLPDQLYFARDPKAIENAKVETLKRQVKEANKVIENNRSQLNNSIDPNKQPEIIDTDIEYTDDSGKFAARKYWLSRAVKNMALDQGVIKPFRNYHLLTSTWNIIDNNISNASYNTFNTVTVQYGDDNPSIDETQQKVVINDLETFTLKCDAALPDEDVRELFAQYPNCAGYEMAKSYAVGLLFHSLKAGYRGNITIMGNPRIKPYDICEIFDEYTDMYGPIEVEQVTHVFNQERGFITEIIPNMVVHVNQVSTISTSDVMGLALERMIPNTQMHSATAINQFQAGNIGQGILSTAAAITGASISGVMMANEIVGTGISPIANAVFNSTELSSGQGASNNPINFVGAFIFRKLLTRTQLEHPLRFSPLVKNGKPMIGGLPNKKTDGSFVMNTYNYFKEGSKGFKLFIEDTYENLFNGGSSQGSFFDAITGNEK